MYQRDCIRCGIGTETAVAGFGSNTIYACNNCDRKDILATKASEAMSGVKTELGGCIATFVKHPDLY